MSHIVSLSSASFLLSALLAAGCATDVADTADIADDSTEVGVRGRFDLFTGVNGQYYFHLESGNGAILLSSEGYTSRAGALNGILSVLDNGGLAPRYRVSAGQDGLYYVSLKSGNGQIIGTSEGYATSDSANRAIGSCVRAVSSYLEHWDGLTGSRFEVFEGSDGRFYFRLFARNGAQVLRSQGYSDEASALNGAFMVADYGRSTSAYVVNQTTTGFYFNLMAPNNRVIATSEIYSTRSNAEAGRDAIIALLPTVELL